MNFSYETLPHVGNFFEMTVNNGVASSTKLLLHVTNMVLACSLNIRNVTIFAYFIPENTIECSSGFEEASIRIGLVYLGANGFSKLIQFFVVWPQSKCRFRTSILRGNVTISTGEHDFFLIIK